MGQVSVTVNGHPYKIACDDGQEPRIRRLAQHVDARIGEFVKTVGQVGEARLLLLAALMIADELSDAYAALQQEESRHGVAEPTADDAGAAAGIFHSSPRIEPVAAHLDHP
jgi:cell division protein ZapA